MLQSSFENQDVNGNIAGSNSGRNDQFTLFRTDARQIQLNFSRNFLYRTLLLHIQDSSDGSMYHLVARDGQFLAASAHLLHVALL